MRHIKLWITLLVIVFCMSIVVFAVQEPAAETSSHDVAEGKQSHREKLEKLRDQRKAEGWAEVNYELCRHGGATDFNDLTLQRTIEGKIEIRHFCPWLLKDFVPQD